ncbi:MAG: hypothetical protein RJB38_1073 [Pseudomonadota bacterium]|jgi:hypothetical protein
MNQKQFQILKIVFWAALGLTGIAFLGSITEKVLQSKRSSRTQSSSSTPIPVPADSTPPSQ